MRTRTRGKTEAERAVAEEEKGFGLEDGGADGVGADVHERLEVTEPAGARRVSFAELVLEDPGAVFGDVRVKCFVAVLGALTHLYPPIRSAPSETNGEMRGGGLECQKNWGTHPEYKIPDIASGLVRSVQVPVELQTVDVGHGVAMPISDSQVPIAGADKILWPFIARVDDILGDFAFGGLA